MLSIPEKSAFSMSNISVTPSDCVPALKNALTILNEDFSQNKEADDKTLLAISSAAGGDVRMSIGILENTYYISEQTIDISTVSELLPSVVGHYDRDGDVHYDLLSCLQKSIRGSDADAAVFYLAKILAGGDLLSACRRLLVIASEDVGLAYPLAAVITYSCVESAKQLGLPEAAIPLSNAVCMLATAPKSNTSYLAFHAANDDIKNGRGIQIPEHLASPLFKGYLYPHEYVNNFVSQTYLPNDLIGRKYYVFGNNKTEQAAKAYMDMIKAANNKA